MTTITIENGFEKLNRTKFKNLEELLNFLLEKEFGNGLLPVQEKELTATQIQRINQAKTTDKSKMLNI